MSYINGYRFYKAHKTQKVTQLVRISFTL